MIVNFDPTSPAKPDWRTRTDYDRGDVDSQNLLGTLERRAQRREKNAMRDKAIVAGLEKALGLRPH